MAPSPHVYHSASFYAELEQAGELPEQITARFVYDELTNLVYWRKDLNLAVPRILYLNNDGSSRGDLPGHETHPIAEISLPTSQLTSPRL